VVSRQGKLCSSSHKSGVTYMRSTVCAEVSPSGYFAIGINYVGD
jgi:hypothetical protein